MNNSIDSPITPYNDIGKIKSNKKPWVVTLVIFSAILFLSVAGFVVYREFFAGQDTVDEIVEVTEDKEEVTQDLVEEDDQEEVTEEEEEEDKYTVFEGEVLSAQLPEGWSMVEYFDGDGTDSLPEEMGEYTGLTAIDIVNPDNLQVFTIQAVSGIGFVGCPNYPLFEDDNETYRLVQEGVSDEMGESLNITDYTDEDYVEFEFLGVTFRRIGEKYFYDTQEGNNYFEPPCIEGLLTLEGLYFTDEDGIKYESYFYGGTEDATLEDLKVVDEILSSIELI